MNSLVDCDDLLDEKAAANMLKLKNHRTLSVWRSTKRYNLPYIKVGGNVRYRKSDLMQFLYQGQRP